MGDLCFFRGKKTNKENNNIEDKLFIIGLTNMYRTVVWEVGYSNNE